MKTIITMLTFFVLLNFASSAQTIDGFSFQKYPVKEVYKGSKAPLNFTGNADAKAFRTRIKEGYKTGQVDFAGYYVTIYWGCGTGCSMGAMVDVRDGKIYTLPDNEENRTNYCGDGTTYGGKNNSRMYVTPACGYNEENPKPVYTVFVWNEISKKFKQVSK